MNVIHERLRLADDVLYDVGAGDAAVVARRDHRGAAPHARPLLLTKGDELQTGRDSKS